MYKFFISGFFFVRIEISKIVSGKKGTCLALMTAVRVRTLTLYIYIERSADMSEINLGCGHLAPLGTDHSETRHTRVQGTSAKLTQQTQDCPL